MTIKQRKEAMIKDIQRASDAKCSDRTVFLHVDYIEAGGCYGYSKICHAFGSWTKAKLAAGMIENKPNNSEKEKEVVAEKVFVIQKCLRCDKLFKSWDRKLNRICDRCKHTEDWLCPPQMKTSFNSIFP